jgi:hypothetical protein
MEVKLGPKVLEPLTLTEIARPCFRRIKRTCLLPLCKSSGSSEHGRPG